MSPHNGGLGLPHLRTTAPAAFVAQLATTLHKQALRVVAGMPDPVVPADLPPTPPAEAVQAEGGPMPPLLLALRASVLHLWRAYSVPLARGLNWPPPPPCHRGLGTAVDPHFREEHIACIYFVLECRFGQISACTVQHTPPIPAAVTRRLPFMAPKNAFCCWWRALRPSPAAPSEVYLHLRRTPTAPRCDVHSL